MIKDDNNMFGKSFNEDNIENVDFQNMNNNYGAYEGQQEMQTNQQMGYQGQQGMYPNQQMGYQGQQGMYPNQQMGYQNQQSMQFQGMMNQNDNMQMQNNDFDMSTISEYKQRLRGMKEVQDLTGEVEIQNPDREES